MSVILEALKKAERQHKLGEVPGISAQASERHAASTGRMGWVMLALFAAIMLGAGLYLGGMQSPSEPQPQPQPQAQSKQPPSSAGELTARPVRPLPKEMPTAPVASEAVPGPSSPVSVKPQPVEADDTEVAIAEPPPVKAPENVPAPAPEPPPPSVKLLHEMPSGFVANLPAMNIDIHSYDPRPTKRYALINMEKYREGDYLAEGPLLIEILPEGVVMEHMGARFILPLGNL